MRSAIGNTFILNLILIFIGIMMIIYVGGIAYNKGFKIRNRIIDIIEENGGYTASAKSAIAYDLTSVGYKVVTNNPYECSDRQYGTVVHDRVTGSYDYCVYEFPDGSGANRGTYYGVTVFISFDIPIVSETVKIPIYGEGRVIYDKNGINN